MNTQKYHFAIVVLLLGVVLLPVTRLRNQLTETSGSFATLCQFTSQTPSGSSSLASSGPRVVSYSFSPPSYFLGADLFKPMAVGFSDIGSRWHRSAISGGRM